MTRRSPAEMAVDDMQWCDEMVATPLSALGTTVIMPPERRNYFEQRLVRHAIMLTEFTPYPTAEDLERGFDLYSAHGVIEESPDMSTQERARLMRRETEAHGAVREFLAGLSDTLPEIEFFYDERDAKATAYFAAMVAILRCRFPQEPTT